MKMEKVFDLFSEEGEKPTGVVFFERIPSFDPLERVDEIRLIETPLVKYDKILIKFKRPLMGATHHKVFHTLLRFATLKEVPEGYVAEYDFAQIKKYSGLHPNVDFERFEKYILERFKYMSLTIERKTKKEKRWRVTSVIHGWDVIERRKGGSLKLSVTFSREFIEIVKKSTLFSIPLNILLDLHKIEDPIVYRLLTFFITQTKKQKHEVFALLERLSFVKFNTPKKRNRVFKAIEENQEILEKYGIYPEIFREGNKKFCYLNFKKPKIQLKLADHNG